MLAPSQHRQNAEALIASTEAEAEALGYPDKYAYQSGAFKSWMAHYAGLVDQENAERIKEQREANTISHVLNVLEVAEPDDITDAEYACFLSFLASKMAEREKPVAWARKGLNMQNAVIELEEQMRSALENDGYIVPSLLDDAADRAWEQR